jgi:hypothetical protein
MSATLTIKNYYCSICGQISFALKNIFTSYMMYFELVGFVRCAEVLSRMGHEKESRTLLVEANKLRVGKKL